jgi:hypothetical protein
VLLLTAGLVLYAARVTLLQAVGDWLTVSDELHKSDIAIMTPDAGHAAEIELADLFTTGIADRVGVLSATLSPSGLELARRGVQPLTSDEVLRRLGVPSGAIEIIPAGEGGTHASTAALVQWCKTARVKRIILVTAADHGQRVKRTVSRAFGQTGPEILVRGASLSGFRSSDWWRDRGSLRAGIIELQKLVLDYALHPLPSP